MSNLIPDNDHTSLAAVAAPSEVDRGTEQSVSQADIDDILSNTAMTIEEKQARLQAYAGDVSSRSPEDRGSEFEPLQAQILDALSLLADGGHAYGSGGSPSHDASLDAPAIQADHEATTR